MKIEIIPADLIDCNDWNPNEMSAKMRQILVDNLTTIGMVDPLLVVKTGDRYRIVDGEHRYTVAVELGYKELPCVILTDGVSETEQKKQTIRMNQIKGQLSYDKFNNLVDSLRNSFQVEESLLPFKLGFESANDMNMLYPIEEFDKDKAKKESRKTDTTVSLQHLYKITEKFFNGEKTGCFLIAHIDKERSLLLEFNDEQLMTLEAFRASVAAMGEDFESQFADVLRKGRLTNV
jgi:hypothetical protein